MRDQPCGSQVGQQQQSQPAFHAAEQVYQADDECDVCRNLPGQLVIKVGLAPGDADREQQRQQRIGRGDAEKRRQHPR